MVISIASSGPVQTVMKDGIPMSKLKLKLSNEAKKTFPFVERRSGGKIYFSLEKDDEIKTRPGEPTGKFIPNEKHGVSIL